MPRSSATAPTRHSRSTCLPQILILSFPCAQFRRVKNGQNFTGISNVLLWGWFGSRLFPHPTPTQRHVVPQSAEPQSACTLVLLTDHPPSSTVAVRCGRSAPRPPAPMPPSSSARGPGGVGVVPQASPAKKRQKKQDDPAAGPTDSETAMEENAEGGSGDAAAEVAPPSKPHRHQCAGLLAFMAVPPQFCPWTPEPTPPHWKVNGYGTPRTSIFFQSFGNPPPRRQLAMGVAFCCCGCFVLGLGTKGQ